MSEQEMKIKTLAQRKADLNDRKAALAQRKKDLDDKIKAYEQKKKKFYMIGLGVAAFGFIFTSFSFILGIIIAALGIGFIVFLNKKGEILFKHSNDESNNEDLKKLIKEESEVIAADEAAILEEEAADEVAILEEEAAERKRIEEEEYKRKENDPQIIESIRTDCEEIFNVVASYGVKHFEEGLSKKVNLYKEKLGAELTRKLFRHEIQKMYFEYNDTVKTTLFNRIGQYSHDARMRVYFRLGVENVEAASPMMARHAAAITLRALHFEKHGQHQEEYKSITENDCREFISNCEYIKREIDQAVAKDPFNVNEKKLIDEEVNAIFDIFRSIKPDNGWYFPSDSENYYADSLCNGFWKWVAEDYENGDSTDPNVALAILMKHFTPSESSFEFLAKERRENDRRKAINEQCSSCALCGGFGRRGPCREYRENCPSWVPRS